MQKSILLLCLVTWFSLVGCVRFPPPPAGVYLTYQSLGLCQGVKVEFGAGEIAKNSRVDKLLDSGEVQVIAYITDSPFTLPDAGTYRISWLNTDIKAINVKLQCLPDGSVLSQSYSPWGTRFQITEDASQPSKLKVELTK